jgi:diacylglycerol kinase family enzyme
VSVHRRLQLVVNPSAGGGRASAALPSVEAALRAAGHDVVVTPTRSLAHTDDLVADALADERLVVAMGGDGLVGRAAAAVSAGSGLMAVLPGGRGNDFCRAVGLPCEPLDAVHVVSDGQERAVDLGVVGSEDGDLPFLGIASIACFEVDSFPKSCVQLHLELCHFPADGTQLVLEFLNLFL